MQSIATTRAHIDEMGVNAREVDKVEAQLLMPGHEFSELLLKTWYGASCSWSLIDGDDQLVAVLGCNDVTTSDRPSHGVAWLIGTELVPLSPIAFYRQCVTHWNLMHEQFDVLVNFIWTEHKESLRLVEHLGATLLWQKALTVSPGNKFVPFRSQR